MVRRAPLILLLVALATTLPGCASRQPTGAQLTPAQTLSLVQYQLDGVTLDVEEAHAAGVLTGQPYEKAKTAVLAARHEYNVVLRRYLAFSTLAESDVDRILALVAAVAKSFVKQPQPLPELGGAS